MIIQKKEGSRINLFWDNQKYIGFCYIEVDGFYVFVHDETNHGCWSEYSLRCISDVLKELNKAWTEQIRNDIRIITT